MALRKRKKVKKIYKFISLLLILSCIVLIFSLIYSNILPVKLQNIIFGGIIVISCLFLFLINITKYKKISSFFTFILIIAMNVISFYLLKTTGFLNNLNLNYKTYNYSVVVLKSSDYDKISDIKNKDLGYYDTGGSECKKSLKKLAKKVSTDNKKYNSVSELAEGLLNNDIDAIVIEDTYLEILKEASTTEEDSDIDLTNFSDSTKVIYTFSIIVKTGDISKDLDVTKKPFNIYISGIDTYGSIANVSRSDVNMIATVNPKTKQILLTSIPRDYYVQLHGKSGYKDKLTHAGLYGTDMSIKTIEDLLDIEINYYVKVNFTSVIDIVDALDGVEVYSEYDFTSMDNYHYTKGYNKVDGKQALSFARERKAFASGDRQRVRDQQALLEAMFRKCTKPSIIAKYSSLLDSIDGKFTTNMSSNRLTSLIKMQLAKNYKWTITSNSLDGTNSYNYTYSYSSSKLYVMEPIEETVTYATKLINSVIKGKKLDPSYDGNASDVHDVTSYSSSSSSSNSSSSEENRVTTNTTTPKNTEGLKASLIKSSIYMTEGDEYIYHGYSATYNGSTVTNSTSVTFSINGEVITDYKELISYISSQLSAGEYNIVYKITYKGSSVTLNQSLVISAPTYTNDDPYNSTDDETIDNTQESDISTTLES